MYRFFKYHAALIFKNQNIIKEESLLNEQAIEMAFREVGQSYKGEALLNDMKDEFMSFAMKGDIAYVRISRGMLLYGPPGTGKTTLTDKLPRWMGFTSVCPPLSSAEVNRSLVGVYLSLIFVYWITY